MNIKNKKILVTGAAGFIGAALVERFLEDEVKIIGIDNFNDYYNPLLKQKRVENIARKDKNKICKIHNINLKEKNNLNQIFESYSPNIVVNLAAQAGVRYSLENPDTYAESNLLGFLNILEGCRNFNVEHLIYASSSSVYGGNKIMPFSEDHSVDHPLSLYAATKKSNEMLAHSYSHLFEIPTTGLRFFTVYGPFGRPDMAPMIFADSILNRKPINVFNNGLMTRDFTFISDIVEAIYKCCLKKPTANKYFYENKPEPSTSFAPHRIFNVGSNNPINLMSFIEKLEDELGISAIKKMKPIQPGDVKSTFADITKLSEWINYRPSTSFDRGIHLFANWYKDYFKSDYYRRPS